MAGYTELEMQVMAKTAAKEAVGEMMLHLGIDATNPLKTQAEFMAVRELAAMMKDEELLEDMAFIRRLRKTSDTIKDTTWKTIAKVVATTAVGIFVLGTKEWWATHIGALFGGK